MKNLNKLYIELGWASDLLQNISDKHSLEYSQNDLFLQIKRITKDIELVRDSVKTDIVSDAFQSLIDDTFHDDLFKS